MSHTDTNRRDHSPLNCPGSVLFVQRQCCPACFWTGTVEYVQDRSLRVQSFQIDARSACLVIGIIDWMDSTPGAVARHLLAGQHLRDIQMLCYNSHVLCEPLYTVGIDGLRKSPPSETPSFDPIHHRACDRLITCLWMIDIETGRAFTFCCASSQSTSIHPRLADVSSCQQRRAEIVRQRISS